MTIIVVTHELESAFKIADTITVLDQGDVLMTGTVDAVRHADNERIQDLLNRRPARDPGRRGCVPAASDRGTGGVVFQVRARA
jgi:ABC-type transporter Mla maintaining outer membrane lipid asymmetry ATPase subunit MlaF